MNPRSTLARQAIRAAHATRLVLGVDRTAPVCPFDAAEQLGIEVKFRSETSMDGMYVRSTRPSILISTHRSSGRRSSTCGHELGHHVLGHGTSVDEVLDDAAGDSDSLEEFAANMFAGFFLMPKSVVQAALDKRSLQASMLTAIDAYRIACNLGVSYAGLVKHLHSSLSVIDASHRRTLLQIEPKQIKAQLAPSCPGNVWPVDLAWAHRSVDVEVGDAIVAPEGTTTDGPAVAASRDTATTTTILFATQPGVARLTRGDWNVFVRVQRREFVGRSIFRHLEDPDAS